jgi:hypothetical protein
VRIPHMVPVETEMSLARQIVSNFSLSIDCSFKLAASKISRQPSAQECYPLREQNGVDDRASTTQGLLVRARESRNEQSNRIEKCNIENITYSIPMLEMGCRRRYEGG